MELKKIKLTDLWTSKNNLRGEVAKDKDFDDLVKSVKEKGVLVPILARPHPGKKEAYEVVAGDRRLLAAREAGLKEIPAKVEEMDDDEAAEASIVENLQRAGVHPLEEGEAYRKLVEDGGRSVADVAVKVGKVEAYVRQRLFLTNLAEGGRRAYRAGKIKDSVAYELAKLAPNDQQDALKNAGAWRMENARKFREWVEQEIGTDLNFQPWLGDKEVARAVGSCTECPPNRATLFGEVAEGECTSRACWAGKMERYVVYLRKKEKDLVPIVLQYGRAPKGCLSMSDFVDVTREKKCEHAQPAVVVTGKGVGKRKIVCASKECKRHGHTTSSYTLTVSEVAARKREVRRQRAAKKRADAERERVLKKVKWPMKESVLEAILIKQLGRGPFLLKPIMKRRGIEAETFLRKNWERKKVKEKDYVATLKKLAEDMTPTEKLRLAVDIMLEDIWEEGRKKMMEAIK